MDHTTDTIRCNGCGVEILWSPIVSGERDYCCEDCRQGWPCDCGERQEQEDDQRDRPGGRSGLSVSGV